MEIGVEEAVAWIAAGGIVAFPTETVWGLAADARSDAAVGVLRDFKGRAGDAPISILVTGLAALAPLGFRVGSGARRLAEQFWPGPLTLVIACGGGFAAGVARSGDGAVGVRCSPHPLARALADACEGEGAGPVTATSCNRSGAPAVRSRDEALRVCAGDDRLRVLSGAPDAGGGGGVDAARAVFGQASTVVDVTAPRPRVLRWGALSERALGPVLEELAA